jgi:hypothetical protein
MEREMSGFTDGSLRDRRFVRIKDVTLLQGVSQ